MKHKKIEPKGSFFIIIEKEKTLYNKAFPYWVNHLHKKGTDE